MKLRLILVLLSAALSLCLPADRVSNQFSGTWTPSIPSEDVPSGRGVNIHFTDAEPGEVEMIAGAGFRWIRMDLKWDATEREKDRYDFSAYDRLLAALDQHSIRALCILDYGNPLYGGSPPRNEVAQAAFTRWAVAAAKHFRGRGVLWEIYNEPNTKMFWPPQPDVNEYIALALRVGRAFRTELPNEKLIGPATSGIDFAFLGSCFRAGLLDYWSAVSVHPYRQSNPETAANEYQRLRQMIDRYAKRTIPIMSGEWGYSAAWPGINEQRQSEIYAREMLTNIANGIPLSIWYDWRDDGSDAGEPEHHFGLVQHESLLPKSSYLAAKVLGMFSDGYQFEKRLPIGSGDDYVLAFRKGSEVRVAAWTTLPLPHNVVIPIEPGDWIFSSHTGETKILPVTSAGLNIQLSQAPQYLRRKI